MATVRRRRLGAGVGAAVVAGVLVAAAVADGQVQWQLQRNQSRTATTTALLRRTASLLRTTTASLRGFDAAGDTAQKSMAEVTAELASARQQLTRAQSGLSSGDIEVTSVASCASGVSRSASELQAGDQAQAVAALKTVAPVCENILDPGPGGPVYPFDFADPDVLLVHGTYYAYGTNSTAGNIQIMESTDLEHWTKEGDALPTLPSWATPGSTWAPGVISLKRTYLLYYTAAAAGSKTQCLSVATARRPAGPFVDTTKAPLECQPALGGSIDPSPYLGPSGLPYLAWKSIGGDGQPATIWAQALDRQGTALAAGHPTALLHPTEPWQGSVVEAPTMTEIGGSWFLFYSGNNWDSADYAIGVARCAGVLGPCMEPLAEPLLGSESNLEGPGGETVFEDAQGNLEMAFQAWMPGAVGYPHPRLLFIRPLTVVDGIPRLEPATG